MTYNEWRDELKSNLLCVSEAERRRVLDYYAEAYADRRDAGFSEREIIEDFGAPYDAAQRILSENSDYDEPRSYRQSREDRREERAREREERAREREEREREREERRRERDEFYESAPPPRKAQRSDYTWVFVLLCIVFAVPIFSLVMSMVGITIAFCVAPFGMLISGIASVFAGFAALFVDGVSGALTIGTGLIAFGAGLILIPVCLKLVKWMWKLFQMFFAWLKRLFSGKTGA